MYIVCLRECFYQGITYFYSKMHFNNHKGIFALILHQHCWLGSHYHIFIMDCYGNFQLYAALYNTLDKCNACLISKYINNRNVSWKQILEHDTYGSLNGCSIHHIQCLSKLFLGVTAWVYMKINTLFITDILRRCRKDFISRQCFYFNFSSFTKYWLLSEVFWTVYCQWLSKWRKSSHRFRKAFVRCIHDSLRWQNIVANILTWF